MKLLFGYDTKQRREKARLTATLHVRGTSRLGDHDATGTRAKCIICARMGRKTASVRGLVSQSLRFSALDT